MSPILLRRMIEKKKILDLVTEKLENEMFLVDLSVNSNNVIHVEIDSFTGLTIDQCVAISRHIESNLDRETEDFELQVSSPGADQPFKVKEQYIKNIGRQVEITRKDGSTVRGKLTGASKSEITVETSDKEKVEGSNKRVVVARSNQIQLEEIEKARVIISFK